MYKSIVNVFECHKYETDACNGPIELKYVFLLSDNGVSIMGLSTAVSYMDCSNKDMRSICVHSLRQIFSLLKAGC